MKRFVTAIKIICFCILFVFCGKVFRYLLIDDTASYTRIMMHEFYNQESNIDILFVGSSHCYRSLIPEVADTVFQKNTFNAGSSGQQLDGSLAMIKEAVRENDVEQVYLELYYDIAFRGGYKQRSNMTMTYILSDYMKPSMDKIVYLLEASSKEHYVNSFILARRNWEKLFEPDYILRLLREKNTDKYRNYTDEYITDNTEIYLGKGCVISTNVLVNGLIDYEHSTPIDTTNISEDWKKSLIEIINYCNNKDIELILFSAPMPNMLLTDIGNYDVYIDFVEKLVEEQEKNVKYYDFNLCKDEYIPNDNALFKDFNHLNGRGAELFSNVFSNFFAGQISEEELFYDSYEQKLRQLPKDIFGVRLQEDRGNCLVAIESVTNADADEIIYEVIKYADDKELAEVVRLQDLSQVGYLKGETGVFEIVVYLSGKEESRVTYEYGK